MEHIKFFVEAAFLTGEDKFVQPYYEQVESLALEFGGSFVGKDNIVSGSGKDEIQIAKYSFENEENALNFKTAFEKEENASYCLITQNINLDTNLVDAAGGLIADEISPLDKFAHELGESIMMHVLKEHVSKTLDPDSLALSLESIDKLYDMYQKDVVSNEEIDDLENKFTQEDILNAYQSGVMDGISSSSALVCGLIHPLLGETHDDQKEI